MGKEPKVSLTVRVVFNLVLRMYRTFSEGRSGGVGGRTFQAEGTAKIKRTGISWYAWSHSGEGGHGAIIRKVSCFLMIVYPQSRLPGDI